MLGKKGMRYSTATLLGLVAAIAVPLGLSMSWTAVSALLACIVAAACLWIGTRRRIAGAALLTYLVLLPVVFCMTIIDVNPSNPYVRQYNERLERIATEAGLVGSAEERVRIVLGKPTSSYSSWNKTVTETGEPTSDAEYGTTYRYAPYWFFPFSTFEVHCRDGIVRGIELYDD